ncbi:uncharacterized protein J2T07_000419 [Luteibacter jiangsuensis]|uniref:Radical SAM core domain-containing protein n=1 Tax=Luteibacter jiangsuensis TaxID=637577 RepID=A0ABT9STZ4_9GAMM|nr:radical SAM protein [Luteibacter jiangsuensis]MDQ0008260.1 uncharacterized protein [Luteibacter jiangsuensis]
MRHDGNRHLHLTILPTERCNFRCTYCYEDFAIGKMKRPVVDGIKNLIRRRVENAGLKSLQFEWFGGEPLVAKDIVHELADYAYGFYERGDLEEFEGGLTTNAFLLDPSTLEALVSRRQRNFQISLDGDEEAHNRSRRYANGSGTFREIWANLVSAHSSDLAFETILRLHIMPGNEQGLYELTEKIVAQFGGDPRYSVYVRHISDLGGTNLNAKEMQTISMADAHRISLRIEERLVKAGFAVSNGVGNIFESAIKVTDIKLKSDALAEAKSSNEDDHQFGYICYAAKPNHLMIRADGRLGKCTVALNSKGNDVGRLLEDGRVQIDDERMNFWLRGHLSRNPEELGCPAHSYG